MTTNEAAERLREGHAVFAGGPVCGDNCPGEWSPYHDGYADGYERGYVNGESAERRATVERIAEDVAKAIGGFLWLANNLENVNSPQFVGMFRAAAEDARPIYDKYVAIPDEEAAR